MGDILYEQIWEWRHLDHREEEFLDFVERSDVNTLHQILQFLNGFSKPVNRNLKLYNKNIKQSRQNTWKAINVQTLSSSTTVEICNFLIP